MKNRDIYFDNLKAILILLVVLGHFTNLNSSSPLMGALNNVIYSFHMPIFIFISGYFSKSIISQRAIEIENVLYPYIVFQIIYYVFTKLTGLGNGSLNIFNPTYQNWYLLGLFTWRILIPYCNLFNKKHVLFFTIILSFTIGFCGFNSILGLYRNIYFFPIFILGYYCSDLKALINARSKYRNLFIAISLFSLSIIFLVSFLSGSVSSAISYAYTPYSNYGNEHTFISLFLRLIGFFSSLLISFGLLFLIPKNKFKFTYFGENSMNIFLLHMFFVYPINHFLVSLPSYLVLMISLASSTLICLLFSNRLTNTILNPLTKLKELILFAKGLNVRKVRFQPPYQKTGGSAPELD